MDDIPGELPHSIFNNYIEPYQFRQVLACRPFVAADESHVFQSRDRFMGLQVLDRLLLPLVQELRLVENPIGFMKQDFHIGWLKRVR